MMIAIAIDTGLDNLYFKNLSKHFLLDPEEDISILTKYIVVCCCKVHYCYSLRKYSYYFLFFISIAG